MDGPYSNPHRSLGARPAKVPRSRMLSARRVPGTRQLEQDLARLQGAHEVYAAVVGALLGVTPNQPFLPPANG
jgi:hypothetical protein